MTFADDTHTANTHTAVTLVRTANLRTFRDHRSPTNRRTTPLRDRLWSALRRANRMRTTLNRLAPAHLPRERATDAVARQVLAARATTGYAPQLR